MLLDGFSFSGFRSFGEGEQVFGDLQKINFLIGQNNVGKSNVFSALSRYFPNAAFANNQEILSELAALDKPFNSNRNGVVFGVLLKRGERLVNNIFSKLSWLDDIQKKRLSDLIFSGGATQRWIWIEIPYGTATPQITVECISRFCNQLQLNRNDLYEAFRLSSNMSGGSDEAWKSEITKRFSPIDALRVLKIELIPATRSVKNYTHPKLTGTDRGYFLNGILDRSGIGLVEELFKLQNPTYERPRDKYRFKSINNFLRDVLGNPSAQIQIPHNKTIIQLELDDKLQPLESLGSGVEELVIIAAHCTVIENSFVCIEEPELHLHPSLQRKLIRYLSENTDNQYLIATHSAHILDASDASIYHVEQRDGVSKARAVLTDVDRFMICEDLGYRASDLLQANSIVWVEGPSDRVYLNYWINKIDPVLAEGTHYSIMFYGGRLLSHLSASDNEVSQFIKLRSLNRNVAILIDSDRKKSADLINNTKQRVVDEFDEAPGFVWVTEGREIENYLSKETLASALKNIDSKFKRLGKTGKFSKHTVYYSSGEQSREVEVKADKVKLAHAVSALPVNFAVLDLETQAKRLVNFIRRSNGMNYGISS